VVYLGGGLDSFNLLVPHSNCGSKDLHQQYRDVRGSVVRLEQNVLHSIDVPARNQPCDTFGIHPSMTVLKEAYDAGDAAFIANMGALVEPITKANMNSKELPPSLFAHNIMNRHAQNLHPQMASASGVIGRMVDALNSQANPFKTEAYSVSGNEKILEGVTPPYILDKSSGVVQFEEYQEMAAPIEQILTQHRSQSVFADTYSSFLGTAFNSTQKLGALLSGVSLTRDFNDTSISKQFKQVARVLRAQENLPNDEKTERAAFIVSQGSYDTHNEAHETLASHLSELNNALESFRDEMVDASIWDDVAIVTLSDFGRTLTTNGLGTDHAWGGNYFMMGGAVKGEQILGEYPDDLTDDSDVNMGRGRIVPTRSWDAMWHSIAKWFGVEDTNLASVLPNMDNFKPPKASQNLLFSKSDLFK